MSGKRSTNHPVSIGSGGTTRREMLCRCANGFGGLALAYLLAGKQQAQAAENPLAPRPPHYRPKAKSVIFLFMDGGPSQMDTFDPKPRLRQDHGRPIPMKTPTTVFNIGDKVLGSPFEFRRHGQSGTPVSSLFPHVAECVDKLTIVRSMVSDHSEHTAANYFIHSGSGFQGRPSMGGWVVYGLGSECDNLPGFVVLESGLVPPGGLDLFGSGFLPASYQGTLFRKGSQPVADLEPREKTAEAQQAKLGLLRSLNEGVLERFGKVSEVEATIRNYELAFRMQTAVPDLVDLSSESEATRQLYGLGESDTEEFGRQCLLARRMVERGVRFVELLPPARKGIDRWDQHSQISHGHVVNAGAVDKPIAGLLKDLESRGMLEETIVLWGGEFGRTPCAQGDVDSKGVGRDHNPFGFTMWMAGGGFKPGITYGATDEFGYYAIEDKVHVHDLHATILHLLGLDHKRLTYRFSGRDMRLTDVHGELIRGILA
jgi:hypothetical protein